MPEFAFRGRQNHKLQFAILAAAALRGGTEPDLLEDVAWWQTDDFWQYALYAAVAYIRAAARRTRVPVRQACQELVQRWPAARAGMSADNRTSRRLRGLSGALPNICVWRSRQPRSYLDCRSS